MGNSINKILVVVDYQNDFVSGSLGSKEAVKIEGEILKLLNKFSPTGSNSRVVFTMDSHYVENDYYLKSREGRHLPILHCVEGTEGAELYGKVKTWYDTHKENKYVFSVEKSTFGEYNLDFLTDEENKDEFEVGALMDAYTYLDDHYGSEDQMTKMFCDLYDKAHEKFSESAVIPDEIHLCGVATNVCVLSNAVLLQNRFPEAEIYVYEKACASYDDDLHQKALDIMRGIGINIVE